MGQAGSVGAAAENFLPNTFQTIAMQITTLTEISDLSFEEFQKNLSELNEISKRCFESSDNILIFAVKKSTADSMLWKATLRIACVKVDSNTKKILSYKYVNLKQFIRICKTFKSHLDVMVASENQTKTRNALELLSPSVLMNGIEDFSFQSEHEQPSTSSDENQFNECCICLDRKPEVLLPCTHSYCCPCIEQWNMTNKNCPICQESLKSTDETWVLSELPDMQEVNEELVCELSKLTNTNC